MTGNRPRAIRDAEAGSHNVRGGQLKAAPMLWPDDYALAVTALATAIRLRVIRITNNQPPRAVRRGPVRVYAFFSAMSPMTGSFHIWPWLALTIAMI
jgi:hypothetical protein